MMLQDKISKKFYWKLIRESGEMKFDLDDPSLVNSFNIIIN